MKLSVVIPTYNSEKHIERCLNSILNQTYKNFEILVVNDGSIDNTDEILKKFELSDRRIRIFTQENKGAGAARNLGIEEATGEYIVFIDSDDYIEKEYFNLLHKKIYKEKYDIVFIDLIQEKYDGSIIRKEFMSKYIRYGKEKLIRYQMTGKLPWGGVRKVIKSSVLKSHNIIYSNDKVGEEALFSFKAVRYSKKIGFLSEPVYHYVNNPESQSKQGGNNPWEPVCKNMHQYLLEENLLGEYYRTMNSLALTSLVINCYRVSSNFDFKNANNIIVKEIKSFKNKYSFDIDSDSLERRVRMLCPLIKYDMSFIIVVIAKLKKILS